MNSNQNTPSLSLLIKQFADEPTAARRQNLYAALKHSKLGLRLIETPAVALPQKHDITGPGDNRRVYGTKGPDGTPMLLAFADVVEWHKTDPSIGYIEVDSKTALKMAVTGGNAGIVINSIHESWALIPHAEVLALLEEWTANTVTVPPGHKVVVIHPSPNAHLSQSESGAWIAETGNQAEFMPVLLGVEQMVAQAKQAAVIWIVQPGVLETPSVFEPFLSTLASLVGRSQGVLSHCAVVPHAKEQHVLQMKRLRETGIALHYSAEDGACFVEVHRPDGIVIGMPGEAFRE